jgi:hypothetical protein
MINRHLWAGRRTFQMDSIETLKSTEFAMRNAMLRIDAISEAKTAHEAIFCFGAATAYITVSAELKAITESSWAISWIWQTRPITFIRWPPAPLIISPFESCSKEGGT